MTVDIFDTVLFGHDQRTERTCHSRSFIDKLISAAAPSLVGIAFAWIGFADKLPDVDTPSTTALFVFGLFFYYGTSVLGALCNTIAMKYYELTPQRMEEVRGQLEELRHEGQRKE